MRQAILAGLTAAAIWAMPAAGLAESGYYEVAGVEADDMLKLRAGPGVGFRLILGLPNGTVVRVYSCEQTGSTRWCKVSLKQARGLGGYVSGAYLKER